MTNLKSLNNLHSFSKEKLSRKDFVGVSLQSRTKKASKKGYTCKIDIAPTFIHVASLKTEAIKWIKSKLEYLETQTSCFKLKSINLETKNIKFIGLSPTGNEFEERTKGWIMGFIFFFNIKEEDLK